MVATKNYTYLSVLVTGLILLSYILNAPALIVISAVTICVMILGGNARSSTAVLFYFSSFSFVLLYKGFNMFIFVALSYIITAFRLGRIKNSGFTYVVFLVMYILVISWAGPFRVDLGDFIPIVLLALIFFVCSSVKYEDYEDITDSAIFGFVISGIIGFFVDRIPAMYEILRHNVLWLSGGGISSVTVGRYSGLTYDSNFYGLMCITFISIILYRKNTKHNTFLKLSLVFLIISGILTYSKTYLIVLGLLFIVYLFDANKAFLKKVGFAIAIVAICLIMDQIFEWKLTQAFAKRFIGIESESLARFTTGRTGIWLSYLKYIFGRGAAIVFGAGIGGGSGRVAEHNMYLEFLYKFGTVGCVIWYYYFKMSFSIIRERSPMQKQYSKMKIPLIMLLIYCISLSAMTFHALFAIICVVLFTSVQLPNSETKLQEQEENINRITT